MFISVVTRSAYVDRTACGLWASVPTYGRRSDGLRPLGSSPILGVCGIRLRWATPCVHWTAFGLWALLAPRPRPEELASLVMNVTAQGL